MGFGPPQGRPTVTDDEIAAIMDPPQRVRTLRNILDATGDALEPAIDLYRPYVTGLDRLPATAASFWSAITRRSASPRYC